MTLLTVSLGTLIDRALTELRGPSEKGLQVVLSASIGTSDTTFTLTDGSLLNRSDLIEFGSELMYVTNKSADTVPIFTVARGYYGSTAASHASGDLGEVNPAYSRVRAAEAVKRAFPRLEALGLPLVTSSVFTRVTDKQYVEMPADVREVLRVSYMNPTTGVWTDLPFWEFVPNVPTATVSTGQLLRIWKAVRNTDNLQVAYRSPYRWSTYPSEPVEASTISLREGTQDLPAVYAAAWLIGAREISRQQLERSEEWNQGEPARSGVSTSFLRLKWQDFYRSLDEARRLDVVPMHRPYQKAPRVAWSFN